MMANNYYSTNNLSMIHGLMFFSQNHQPNYYYYHNQNRSQKSLNKSSTLNSLINIGSGGNGQEDKFMMGQSNNQQLQQRNQQSNQHQQILHFTFENRMSLFSLEKRIDYHLSRIMKGHRLINFKNSIERLPPEKRICECIIEVLMSSLNLIARKTRIIVEAKTIVDELNWLIHSSQSNSNNPLLLQQQLDRNEFSMKLKTIKTLAINLEQIVWALNSNKEHIKYIIKVFCVPEQYQRSEFCNDPNSIVPLKQSIIHAVQECQQVIIVCRILRKKIHDSIIDSYLTYFI